MTNSVVNALATGIGSAFVLVMSSMFVSLIRNMIPNEVRIASFILIIATFGSHSSIR